MKTIFIVNPEAGKRKKHKEIVEKITSVLSDDVSIYITKSCGDAEVFVKDYILENGPARFIACGGDGTFGEVLNGMINCLGAQIGIMPMGTGNDFCRNFEYPQKFMDIKGQIEGKTCLCDAIKYSEISGNKTGYCANMFNIGFDCNVADLTSKLKRFVSGHFAYLLSVFINLVKKKGENLKVEADDVIKHNGRLLLTSIANGMSCGGGIKSNPKASLSDGQIDINIIYNVSRINFLSKLFYYIKGTHLKLRRIEKVIHNEKCKKVVVSPASEKMKVSIDGEIQLLGKTAFEIVPGAFNFVLPY